MNISSCFYPGCTKTIKNICISCNKAICSLHISDHLLEPSIHNIERVSAAQASPSKDYLLGHLLDYIGQISKKQQILNNQVKELISSITIKHKEITDYLNNLKFSAMELIQGLVSKTKLRNDCLEELIKKPLDELKEMISYIKAPEIKNCFVFSTFFSNDFGNLRKQLQSLQDVQDIKKGLLAIRSYDEVKQYSVEFRSDKVQEILLGMVVNSNSAVCSELAGKALSVLCEQDFDFSYKDLSNINVSGAMIFKGMFNKTILLESHFNKSFINKSLFSNSIISPELFPKEKNYEKFKPIILPSAVLTCVAITTDHSKIISGSSEGTVYFWNALDTNKSLTSHLPYFSVKLHNGKVNCMDVSKDSQKLLTGSDDLRIILFDIEKRSIELELSDHKLPITCLSLKIDLSLIVSGSSDNFVFLYNLSGKLEQNYKSRSMVTCFAIASFYKKSEITAILFGNIGGDITYVNRTDNKKKFWEKQNIHPGGVVNIILNKTAGRIITAGNDGMVLIWTSKKGKKTSRYFNPRTAEIELQVNICESGQLLSFQGYMGSRFCLSFDKLKVVHILRSKTLKIFTASSLPKASNIACTDNLSHIATLQDHSIHLYSMLPLFSLPWGFSN